jgi:hypothetical protein
LLSLEATIQFIDRRISVLPEILIDIPAAPALLILRMPFLLDRSVRALLISTSNCRTHWVIALSDFQSVFFVNLEGNAFHWTRDSPSKDLFSLDFHLPMNFPGIEDLKGSLYLPESLMSWERPCRCAEWV